MEKDDKRYDFLVVFARKEEEEQQHRHL